MSHYLTNVWGRMTNSDVWQDWPFGSGYHFSRFDSRVYRNLIFSIMAEVLEPKKGFERLVTVGTTTMYGSYKPIALDRIPFLKRRESVA